jgi:hypothetical protein
MDTKKAKKSQTYTKYKKDKLNKKDKTRKTQKIFDMTGVKSALFATPALTKKAEHNLREFCALSAGNAFERLYKIGPKAKFEDRRGIVKEMDNARDWWEHTGAQGQCNSAIGNYSPKMECYICGLELGVDTFTPECEHILPVFHANLFLSLYNPKQKKANDRELKMEYAWAHKCCNQVKSDTGFTVYNVVKNQLELDYPKTKSVLESIYQGERKSDGQAISEKLKRVDKSKWIKERIEHIDAEKIQPICNYVNKPLKESPGLYYLGAIANLTSAANSEMINLAQEKAQVGWNAPPVNESRTIAMINIELAESIAEKVPKNAKRIPPIMLEFLIQTMLSANTPPLLENGDISTVKLGKMLMEEFVSNSNTASIFRDTFVATAIMEPAILDPNLAGKEICGLAYKLGILSNLVKKKVFRGNFDLIFENIKSTDRQRPIFTSEMSKIVKQMEVWINAQIKETVDLIKLKSANKSDRTLGIIATIINTDLGVKMVNLNTSSFNTAIQKYMIQYGNPMTNIQRQSEINHIEITETDRLKWLIDAVESLNGPSEEARQKEYEREKIELEKRYGERVAPNPQEVENELFHSANILMGMRSEGEKDAARSLLMLRKPDSNRSILNKAYDPVFLKKYLRQRHVVSRSRSINISRH